MKYSLFIVLILLFTGCSKSKNTIHLDEKPKFQIPKQPKEIRRQKGSLYSRQGSSLFADKKDLQVGDILQVVIEESIKNSSKGGRSVNTSNASALGAGIITPVEGMALGSKTKKIADTMNRNFGIGYDSSSTKSFSGSSSSTQDEKFNTVISVIIEATYQNGNYLVRGSKEMLIDGQKQAIFLSGIIRPYDISPENTIYSHQLANLKIKYQKNGEESDGTHKQWGTKFVERVWPF